MVHEKDSMLDKSDMTFSFLEIILLECALKIINSCIFAFIHVG